MIRIAMWEDFEAISRLYAQLKPEDSPVAGSEHERVFMEILGRDGLDIIVLEVGGELVGASYLNVIPNLSRGARPYAVVENVVVVEHLRGQKLGQRLMHATLERAWAAGCYKVMLQTGSSLPSTHAYYRACGFSDNEKTAYLARPPVSSRPRNVAQRYEPPQVAPVTEQHSAGVPSRGDSDEP